MARIFSFLLCVYNYLKMRRDFVMFFLSVFRALFPAAADVCFVSRVLGEKEQVPAGCTITCYKTSRAYLELRTGPVINRR